MIYKSLHEIRKKFLSDTKMKILNYNDQLQLAKILREGAIEFSERKNIGDILRDYAQKYKPSPNDASMIEHVFKSYVYYGNNHKLLEEYTPYSRDKINNILFFRQVPDLELTLLGKVILAISGTKYSKDFLLQQVKTIMTYGKIDIRQEYIFWCRSCGDSEESIQQSLQKIEFN